MNRHVLIFVSGVLTGAAAMAIVSGAFFTNPTRDGDALTRDLSTSAGASGGRSVSAAVEGNGELLASTPAPLSTDEVADATAAGSSPPSPSSVSGGGRVAINQGRPTGPLDDERPEEAEVPPGGPGAVATGSVDLPVTHSPLVNDTPIENDYAELQAEERDDSWASGAEALLYTHVVGHPAGQEIGVIAALCKQTQCWLIGTAYGENGRDNWEAVRADFRQQPLFATYFAGIVGESSAAAPDGHRFVTVFLRAGYQPEPMFPE